MIVSSGSWPRRGWSPRGRRPRRPAWSRSRSTPIAIARHAAPELEICRVTDATGIDVHRQVVTAGFGSDRAVALGTACADLLDRPECVVYVGYADGTPVASGLGWRSGRTIGVYSIATVQSARRRGYGAAMTAHVVADGVNAGCDVAVLQASEMGRPIYERQGFRTVVRYFAYVQAARPVATNESRQPGMRSATPIGGRDRADLRTLLLLSPRIRW